MLAFASKYFIDSYEEIAESSLLGYARDLPSFFEYLKSIKNVSISNINLKVLDAVTTCDIEDFLLIAKSYISNVIIKDMSLVAFHNKFYAIRSFFYIFIKMI